MIKTRVRIFRPDEPPEDRVVQWDDDDYKTMRAVLVDLLGGNCDPEHVSVLYDGEPRDMFVDERGHLKGLAFNSVATSIYRTNWLLKHPTTDPRTLPAIAGPALVFVDRIVWR